MLTGETMGAIMPTMSARPNPQIVYASSQGWEISEQLGKIRHRALAAICARLSGEGLSVEEVGERLGLDVDAVGRYLGKAAGPGEGLAFLEWSCRDDLPRTKRAMADRELWAQANPALGIRISEGFVAAELRTMGATEFARERLGVSDYPPDEDADGGWEVIAQSVWEARAVAADVEPPVPGSAGVRRPAFAVDMRPDGSSAAIGAAFQDEAGALVGEVINHRQGSGWVIPRLVELAERYEPPAIAIDSRGPAAALIEPAKRAGIEVLELDTGEVAEAYGQIFQAITEGGFVHLDQEPLNDAVQGAVTRPLGDRVTWDRRGEADICPLVAVTNAAYAHALTAEADYEVEASVY
jgi:hypothetical protein